MRDSDGNAEFVGQDLQFPLPQAHTRAVAAAAIGVDQQPRGDRVAFGAEFIPPATDALDGKGGGIVADAEIDPSDVVGNVIDAVGHRLAQTRDREIVHPDRLRLTLRSQLPPAILEVSDKLLLLCVDRDHWLAGSLERLHLGVDVLELRVTIGMADAFACLAVRLQAEAQTAQQAADQLLAGDEAPLGQRRRQTALALADPQQSRLWIAADRRLHQFVQRLQKSRLGLDRRLAATTPTTHPAAQLLGARQQIRKTAADGAARHARRSRDPGYPAAPGGARFTGGQQTPLLLVQDRGKRFEACCDGSGVDHTSRVQPPAFKSRKLPESFIAFLPDSRFFSSGWGPKTDAGRDFMLSLQALTRVAQPDDIGDPRRRRLEALTT